MSDTYDGAERFVGRRRDEAPGTTARRFRRTAPLTRIQATSDGLQSGLPLTMQEGEPVAPEWTGERRLQLKLKRLLVDIPLAGMAAIALSPLLLGVALAIKLSSKGPVLFAQQRVGLNNEEFRMLKFRTMRTEVCDATGLSQVVADDDRVTPVGRFLRATSLDELPQLWNILAGDMAVIGPRPMVPGMRAGGVDYRELVPYYDFRHLVKPGLSGWAQANGLRGPTDDAVSARQRIDHDCAYVQNFSVGLDIRIVFRTLVREFITGSGL